MIQDNTLIEGGESSDSQKITAETVPESDRSSDRCCLPIFID
ncbi:hypothetical protein [Paenibacillus sp. Root52]|nr:hypothetical protein [Paenibacillus sp. Root52]